MHRQALAEKPVSVLQKGSMKMKKINQNVVLALVLLIAAGILLYPRLWPAEEKEVAVSKDPFAELEEAKGQNEVVFLEFYNPG